MQVVPPVHTPDAHWVFMVQAWPLASRQLPDPSHALLPVQVAPSPEP